MDHNSKDQEPFDTKEVNWLNLPVHVQSLISNKLIHIKDYIRFGAVCHSWYSIYTENKHCLPRQPPLLMLATKRQTHSLYSFTEKKLLRFQVQVSYNKYFSNSSSHGWLVVFDDNEACLLNPFMSVNNKIQLPSLRAFKVSDHEKNAFKDGCFRGFLIKVVLSANPASNTNYVGMAIHSSTFALAFFKPGDKFWTCLSLDYHFIADLIYCREQFYFLCRQGRAYSCNLNDPHYPRVSIESPALPSNAANRYLVESSGDLLQACRISEFEFDVFKLGSSTLEWSKVENLQGRALFLGNGSSFSLSVSDFPDCKPNSIYFTNGHSFGTQDGSIRLPYYIGVFSLDDHTVEQHYPCRVSNKWTQPPIWIEPTLAMIFDQSSRSRSYNLCSLL